MHGSILPIDSRMRAIAWLSIIGLAAFLRLWPIGAGLPYSDYIDEGHVLHQAIKVLQEKTYDIGLYDYPSLPSYLVAAATVAFSPLYRLMHGHAVQEDFPSPAEFHTQLGDVYDLVSPPAFIVLARAVVAAFSIGAVVLTGVLARMLPGRRETLIAMLLMAVCPAAATRGSTVMVDPIATFFALVTLVFCARLRAHRPASQNVVAAGSAAALAFVSKYPVGAVCAAVLVAVMMLDTTAISKLRLLLLSALAFIGAGVVAMPSLVLKPGAVLTAWQALLRNYEKIHSHTGYWGQAISPAELGVPLVAAGLTGVGYMLVREHRSRAAVLSWLAFAALLLAGLISSSFQPFRNLLSLLPLLCIGAAAIVCRAAELLLGARRIHRAFALTIVAVTGVLLVSSLAAESLRQIHDRQTQVDTRVRAVDWLRQHTAKGGRILGLRELAVLPSEWKRLTATPLVLPWFDAADALEAGSFDYIVTGEPDLQLATDPAAWSAYREGWKQFTSPLPALAEFGEVPMFIVPYFWRTNDERILILRGK